LTLTGTWFEALVDPVKVTFSVTPATTKISVPLHGPLPTGLKVTPITQFVPAARLVLQVVLLVDMAKSPLIVGVEMATAEVPALLTVTDSGGLVVPTATPENESVLVETETLVPVPLKLTVCGLLLALSVMVRVPGTVPAAVGVNVTLIVQGLPAARLVPQLLVWVKPVLGVMLEKVSAAVPESVTVTD
jgi:hypothetical protein